MNVFGDVMLNVEACYITPNRRVYRIDMGDRGGAGFGKTWCGDGSDVISLNGCENCQLLRCNFLRNRTAQAQILIMYYCVKV